MTHVRPEVPGLEVPSSPTIASSGRSAASCWTMSALGGGVGLRHDVGAAGLAGDVEALAADPGGEQCRLAHQVGGEGGIGGEAGSIHGGHASGAGVVWAHGAIQASDREPR